MVPVKLKLSNFTSYGDDAPELDFTNFHMAAISGQNGAGKSSLLDSITWCLWGTSRLGDSADQLVRLGQTTMVVEFSFELDGHIFTVKRARILKGGGSTSLELFSGSHNLTEGTIKATQQKIIDTLHLSYETFTNSAFLRQGHADEFTTKGPSDRKRILADILGLSHYDKLEEKAKEKVKEIETKLKLLEYQLLEIEAELSQKEAREKALTEAEAEAQKVEGQLKEVESQIKLIDKERELVTTKLQALEETKTRIEAAQKELTDLKTQISLKEKAQAEYQTILSQRETIELSFLQLQKLQEKKKGLESKRSELITVKDELASLQKQVLELEERRSKKVTLLEIDIKKLQTENEQYQKEVEHLKNHQNLCPTCGQTIGAAKNKEIITKDEAKLKENNDQLKTLQKSLGQVKAFIIPQFQQALEKEQAIQKLEEETKQWHLLNTEVANLEKYADLYTKLQQAATAVKAHQEIMEDLLKISQGKEAQIEKESQNLKEFTSYEEQLQETKNRLQAKETIKQELSQKALEYRSKVGEARSLRDKTLQLEDYKTEKETEKKKLQTEKEAFEELSLAFGKKGIQAMIIETAIPEIEDEANRLLDRLTEGRMKVRFETQRETKTKTNGEYGLVETLDIIISDEMGERPYEAYSGGEQFRVNFAIRLALSKLLTHRAGAKLQFLVIDEGFGTQDAQGRSRIVESMDAIKNDFEKILIITHLEELKEEFPVRVEVSKGPAGSTFEVVGV
ncbi:MAG: SMC family ATPase [bacterium]|nr:SMC family ATPase [bacterium]